MLFHAPQGFGGLVSECQSQPVGWLAHSRAQGSLCYTALLSLALFEVLGPTLLAHRQVAGDLRDNMG